MHEVINPLIPQGPYNPITDLVAHSTWGYYTRGVARIAAREHANGRLDLEQAKEIDPSNGHPYWMLGIEYQYEDPLRAIDEFQKAAELFTVHACSDMAASAQRGIQEIQTRLID